MASNTCTDASTNQEGFSPEFEKAIDNYYDEEIKKLREYRLLLTKEIETRTVYRTYYLTDAEKAEIDARSVFVKNVDYAITAEVLSQYFGCCGTINRVTILTNPRTGKSKGYAYIEFDEVHGANAAMLLNSTMLFRRCITVCMKRTNKPRNCFGSALPPKHYEGPYDR